MLAAVDGYARSCCTNDGYRTDIYRSRSVIDEFCARSMYAQSRNHFDLSKLPFNTLII